MGKNSDTIGTVLIILLVAGALSGREGAGGRAGSLLPMGGLKLGSLANDFHRMVGLMDRVDSIGQMAVNPPKLPEPSQLINTSALPDMSAVMDLVGPLLGGLNSEKI